MHTPTAQVVTVSDEEMREATRALYRAGVVAEVSGAAAVAAVLAGKLGDVSGTHPCRKRAPPRVGQNGAEQASPAPEDARGSLLGAASLGQEQPSGPQQCWPATPRVFPTTGLHVVCTVSGRNIDPDEYEHALSHRPMAH